MIPVPKHCEKHILDRQKSRLNRGNNAVFVGKPPRIRLPKIHAGCRTPGTPHLREWFGTEWESNLSGLDPSVSERLFGSCRGVSLPSGAEGGPRCQTLDSGSRRDLVLCYGLKWMMLEENELTHDPPGKSVDSCESPPNYWSSVERAYRPHSVFDIGQRVTHAAIIEHKSRRAVPEFMKHTQDNARANETSCKAAIFEVSVPSDFASFNDQVRHA